VTTATLLEVTLAISHSDRGSDSRREEKCHFSGTARSHFGDTSRSDFGDTSRSNAEVTLRSVAEVAHFFPTGVTSAIRMRYRGRLFSSSRSHLIVPSVIENACSVARVTYNPTSLPTYVQNNMFNIYGQASCGHYLACNCGETHHPTILNIFHCKRKCLLVYFYFEQKTIFASVSFRNGY